MTYDLLPFRFERLASAHELITNEAGEFIFTAKGSVSRLVNRSIPVLSDEYKDFLAKHIIVDDESVSLLDILCTKLATKKSHLSSGISLQLVVITRRCNQSCRYCQVSKRNSNENAYDMQLGTIDKVVDAIIATASDYFTLEIQGGEPLLVMDAVKYLIKRAKEKVSATSKQMRVVLCTNLTLADSEFYRYCLENDVAISTSLDGPQYLHNEFRILEASNSHELVVNNIKRATAELGADKVSALMTTTKASLNKAREIIDQYISLGLNHIFIRKLNEYGCVHKNEIDKYSPEEFLGFYKECLAYIIQKNREGINIIEVFTTILLKKILTPYDPGFVDLLSPSGAGIVT